MVNTIVQSFWLNILAETCLEAMKRQSKIGSVLERSMTQKMSDTIFMQDGAPAHTAKLTQNWCQQNLPRFWAKPGNSPDLNPIEHLWSILNDKLEKFEQATMYSKSLEKNLEKAWASISDDILDKLVCSMPQRMALVLENDGGYIGM